MILHKISGKNTFCLSSYFWTFTMIEAIKLHEILNFLIKIHKKLWLLPKYSISRNNFSPQEITISYCFTLNYLFYFINHLLFKPNLTPNIMFSWHRIHCIPLYTLHSADSTSHFSPTFFTLVLLLNNYHVFPFHLGHSHLIHSYQLISPVDLTHDICGSFLTFPWSEFH